MRKKIGKAKLDAIVAKFPKKTVWTEKVTHVPICENGNSGWRKTYAADGRDVWCVEFDKARSWSKVFLIDVSLEKQAASPGDLATRRVTELFEVLSDVAKPAGDW